MRNAVKRLDSGVSAIMPAIIMASALSFGVPAKADVWINEFHYDNASTDVNEGVEIAGTAGTSLEGFQVMAYNGSSGASYNDIPLSGVISEETNGVGALWFAFGSLQNGAPDGLALVDAATNLVHFISYEGSFAGTEGPANGVTSEDVGITESSTSGSTNESIQLTGTGMVYSAFTWAGPAERSPGQLNAGQTIGEPARQSPTLAIAPSDTDVKLLTGLPYEIVVTADEPDGDVITLSAIDLPAGASLTPGVSTGAAPVMATFNWTPANSGNDQASFEAFDVDGTGTVSVSFTVLESVSPMQSVVAHINEVVYNEPGTDSNEFFEVVAVAGQNLEGCFVAHYNGTENSDGERWRFTFPSFVVPDDGVSNTLGQSVGFCVVGQTNHNALGAIDFVLPGGTNPFQNGDDGIVLFDSATNVLDAFAWGGAGDLDSDDPGTVVRIGSPESPNFLHVHSSTLGSTGGESAQSPDDVIGDDGAGWDLLAMTPGVINADQVSGQIRMTPSVTVSNALPTLQAGTAYEVALGGTLTFDVEADDPVDGDSVTLRGISLPVGASFPLLSGAGPITNTFVWTNASPVGVYTSVLAAVDIDGTNEASVIITVYAPGVAADLIVSEYGEGSGFNKHLELFNGTGRTLDLSQYALERDTNGDSVFVRSLALSGQLPHNSVYIIVHALASQDLKDLADLTDNTVMTFTGDDQIRLLKQSSVTDHLGPPGGANWAQNTVLVRKSAVTQPNSTYSAAEWDTFPSDTRTQVGFHEMDGLVPPTRPPQMVMTPDNRNPVVFAGSEVALTFVSTEFDGHPITVKPVNLPPGASLSPAVGASPLRTEFRWTPASAGSVTTQFESTDLDGTGTVIEVVFNVLDPVSPFQSVVAHFNEVRFNEPNTDSNEFIEIVGHAGEDLTGCFVVHYNGLGSQDGGLWQFTFPSFTFPDDGAIDDDGDAIGFAVIAQSNAYTVANIDFTIPDTSASGSLQNGPDGLVLYDAQSNILDAVAWNGEGDLTLDDPGKVVRLGSVESPNYLHLIDDQLNDATISLQAPNAVIANSGSGWQEILATPGALNVGQTSGQVILNSSIVLPTPFQTSGVIIIVR